MLAGLSVRAIEVISSVVVFSTLAVTDSVEAPYADRHSVRPKAVIFSPLRTVRKWFSTNQDAVTCGSALAKSTVPILTVESVSVSE